MLHRTRSSSNPDLTTLVSGSSSSSSSAQLKRTNSSSSSSPLAPLTSAPSFCIYASNTSQIRPTQEPSKDFTFVTKSEPDHGKQVIAKKESEKRLPLFLARGLGIDRIGSGLLDAGAEGVKWKYPGEMENGEKVKVETELKRLVEDEPNNAAALRDYAQFLYQVKGDAKKAEEYYSRAILVEPIDGEILSEYAKLVWDLHADVDRAKSYFEMALKASPKNSDVFAAYAAFMWEIEETDEDPIDSNFFHAPVQPEKQDP